MSIRAALGATRHRLIEQLVVENVLLALLGGAIAILFSRFAVGLFVSANPANLPRITEVHVDLSVLAFTLVVSMVTGILVGLVPAMRMSRLDLNEVLKENSRGSSQSINRNRMRSLFVVSQVAVAVVLLTGAMLLIRSFMRLVHVDPGFKAQNVLTMQVSLPKVRYPDPTSQTNFYERVVRNIGTLPGVESAGAVSYLPLGGGNLRYFFNVEGQPRLGPGRDPLVSLRVITPNYFQALGVPLAGGRAFTDQDRTSALKVAIINEATARHYFPGEEPGKRLAISADYSPNGWLTIVGIVKNVRHASLDAEPDDELYLPFAQMPAVAMSLVVRTAQDPLGMTAAVRDQVLSLDRDQPVSDVRSMEQVVSSTLAQPRLTLYLLGAFAATAMMLAALGVYGVMAYSVTQRTHEIGIRVALGARRADLLRMVMGQGIILTLIGLCAGTVASVYLTQVIQGLLFGVSATDVVTFVTVPAVLGVVAMVACYLPARGTSTVDPIVALRYE
jgi:putative ABC transport system permease protein